MVRSVLSRRSFLLSSVGVLGVSTLVQFRTARSRIVGLVQEIFGEDIADRRLIEKFAEQFVEERLNVPKILALQWFGLFNAAVSLEALTLRKGLSEVRATLITTIATDFVKASDYLSTDKNC